MIFVWLCASSIQLCTKTQFRLWVDVEGKIVTILNVKFLLIEMKYIVIQTIIIYINCRVTLIFIYLDICHDIL